MSVKKRRKTSRKKTSLVVLSALFAILALTLATFYFFLESPSFPRFIEKVLSERFGKDVTVGSVTLSDRRMILVENLVVTEKGDEEPLLTLPETKVVLTLSGLLTGSIDSVTLKNPKITIRPEKGEDRSLKKPEKPAFFSLRRGVIEGGEVLCSLRGGKPYRIRGIDLRLTEAKGGGKARIQGSAHLPGIERPLSLEAELDADGFSFDRGSAKIDSVALGDLYEAGVPVSDRARLGGKFSVKATLSQHGSGLRLNLAGAYEDLEIGDRKEDAAPIALGSGTYRAFLESTGDLQYLKGTAEVTADPHGPGKSFAEKFVLAGGYDTQAGELTIEKASLSSDTLGYLDATGFLKKGKTKDLSFDARISGRDVSLPGLLKYCSPAKSGLESIKIRGSIRGTASISGSTAEGARWNSDISVTNLAISAKDLAMDLGGNPLKVTSAGSYDRKKDLLQLAHLRTTSPTLGSWLLGGSLSKAPSGNVEVRLSLDGEVTRVGAVLQSLSGPAAAWLAETEAVAGGVGSFTIRGDAASPDVAGSLHLSGRSLKNSMVQLGPFEAAFHVALTNGRISVSEGAVTGESAMLAFGRERGTTLNLNRWELAIPLISSRGQKIKAVDLAVKTERLRASIGGRQLESESLVSLTGTLVGHVKEKSVALEHFLLEAGDFGSASGDLILNFSAGSAFSVSLEHEGIDVAAHQASIHRLFPALRGAGLKGRVTVDTELSGRFPGGAAGSVTGTLHLNIEKGGFSNENGTRVAEGITTEAKARCTVSYPAGRTEFTADVTASGFELLSGKFYGDFTKRKVTFEVSGEYREDVDAISISESTLSVPGIGALTLSGSLTDPAGTPHFQGEVNLENLQNEEAFSLFLRETYKQSFPILSRIDIRGTTGLSLRLAGWKKTLTAEGELKISDGEIARRDGTFRAGQIQISLPVSLTYPDLTLYPGESRSGTVSIGNLKWRGQNISSLAVTPLLTENALAFADDITVPLFGGSIVLRHVSCQNILRPERELRLSIDLLSLDLPTLTKALGMPAFGGDISGTIPEVRLTGSSLVTEGEVVMKLFGGQMRVKGISISDVFSPVAALKSTIEFEEIDLGRLTDKFDFGHVSGVLQGHVRDLVITRGQPESFDAFVETVKRRGKSQTISVEALEKITVIGTGSSPTVLGRGLYSLFKKYRYRKIGFRASLKNDTFLLIGIEREGDKGYLVRGGILPPKVNVVNYTQTISFREMMKRLSRVNWEGKEQGSQ